MSAAATEVTPTSQVGQFLTQPKKLLIGGKWVDAASGKTFATVNPATEETLAQVAEGDSADIDKAVKSARMAFEDGPWRRMTPSERGKMIWKLADLLEQNLDEFAALESLDNGKPRIIAAVADVPLAVDLFRYMAGWATKIEGNTIPISVPYAPGSRYFAYTQREPIGVVGQIIPWNFPLLMAAWKLGPALATGCTVVLKPAEQTPLTALRLGELIVEAGFPPGVVNILTGNGETTGAALTTHPGVDKVAFTGSTQVGKIINKAATDTLKRVSLELGGKSPVIVFPDVDINNVVGGAANAIFFNSGQVCTAGSRLFAHKSVFDKVVEGVSAAASSIKLGPGLDPQTQMGPLVSREQQERVLGYINAGRSEGASIMVGGDAPSHEGYFVKPTVMVNVKPEMKVVREEIFGPVLVAQRFEDINDIAAMANDTPYGLAASVWSSDVRTVQRIVPKLRAGTVWVNCHNFVDPNMPFGGFKQSGFGREHGRVVLDLYTEVKSVCMAV